MRVRGNMALQERFRQFRYGNPLVSSQVAGGAGRRENAANLRCPGLPGQWLPCVRVGSQRNASVGERQIL